MNNTPTLMQSEEERAPYNKKTKTIEVNISQCLSSTETIEVPIDFEDWDNTEALSDFVREQIMLPSDCLEHEGYWWNIDEFWVGV